MTKLIGILNITPDSFSDGGKFSNTKSAIARIKEMISEGADIIDIGAQSTRPGAKIISSEEEWSRLQPLLNEIKDSNYKIPISIDSFNPDTIKKCLSYNISIINDVSGLDSEEMRDLAANSGKKIVFMHSLGLPANKDRAVPENADIINYLEEWLENKINSLERSNIKKENMIFDPGIGFGKSAQQSLQIIMNAEKFKRFGIEILIGHSEKSFLTLFTDKPAGQRGEETKRFSKILAEKNIDYIRVHDVKGNSEAIKVT